MLIFDNIFVEKKDGLAYLTVNRPNVLNALNKATLAEIGAALEDIRDDPGVSGLIVTGAGNKAFVAGADIAEIAAISTVEASAFTRRGQAVFDLLENLGKPSVAAVNGFALGGGCEFAMACTLRLATASARFGQPEVRLGVTPGFGGTQRLPRLVGKGRALQMILTAEPIDAQEAYRIGLVNEIVVAEKLLERAADILRKIAANAPLAVRFSIEAVNRGLQAGQGEGLVIESALFAVCASSEDKKEGTAAFIGKRQAQFNGR
jgi:enoyl-CoA hydratase